MSRTLPLIDAQGSVADYRPTGTPMPGILRSPADFNRHAIAAAHVVVDPLADVDPSEGAAVDWDRTLAFRLHLLDLGLDIAEAMDTAQRGMGLPFADAMRLIRETVRAAGRDRAHRIYSGVATDQLDPAQAQTLDAIEGAYRDQLAEVQKAGSRVILMASPSLARSATGAGDYVRLYGRLLADADAPVVLHWLGEMFDPRLAGYWGSGDFETAMQTVLEIVGAAPGKVAGIKLSLLDADKERRLRSRLPDGVRLYTGDDFNYPELIAGDGSRDSDALLGIFDPIAPVASAALAALADGDRAGYDALMEPTVPLARAIFRAPTRFYKTGVVFLAWLNGHQDHFAMLGGQQSMRSLPHLCELFRLADRAGLLRDPDMAAARMAVMLKLSGLGG